MPRARRKTTERGDVLRNGAFTGSQMVAILRTLGLARPGEDVEALRRAGELGAIRGPEAISTFRGAKLAGKPGLNLYNEARYPYTFRDKFVRWLEDTDPDPEIIETQIRLGALKSKSGADYGDLELRCVANLGAQFLSGGKATAKLRPRKRNS